MTTIFYSWQSDLPGTCNRFFIEDAVKTAIKNINTSDAYNLELNLDRDTQGTPGTPDITDTIFEKIRNAHIFIGDISLINSRFEGKLCPNPNVLIELGYAASVVGWENVICTYNTAYGQFESLPFDLRSRKPLAYHLDESVHDVSQVRESLIKSLEVALIAIDPSAANFRRMVIKEFAQETPLAQQIALREPRFWKPRLMAELLRSKMSIVNKKYEELDRNLFFRRTVQLNSLQFFDKLIPTIGTLENLVVYLSAVVDDAITSSAASSNPIEIKQAIDKLILGCNELFEVECEYTFIEVNPACEEIRQLLKGSTRHMIDELNTLPVKLEETAEESNVGKYITIRLHFNRSPNYAALMQMLAFYKTHPHLLLEP